MDCTNWRDHAGSGHGVCSRMYASGWVAIYRQHRLHKHQLRKDRTDQRHGVSVQGCSRERHRARGLLVGQCGGDAVVWKHPSNNGRALRLVRRFDHQHAVRRGIWRWEDRSGNSRHATLQADAINAAYTGPTLRASIQNSLSALQFGVDGGGSIGLGLDGVNGMGLTSTGGTIFLVAKVDANNYGAPIAKAQGSYRGWWWQVRDTYGANFVWQDSGYVYSQLQSSTCYSNTFFVIAMSLPSGNLPSSVMYVNGSAVSLSYYASGGGLQVPPSGSDRFTIGYANFGSSSNDYRWKGYIGEVALYDQQLSATAVGDISTFLMSKWGIS